MTKQVYILNILKKPSLEVQNRITLWLNHLLVLYAFLIPINNNAKSSLFFVMLVLFLYRRNYWFYLKEAFSNKIVQAFLLFYLVNAFGMLYTDNIEAGKSHMDKVKYLLFPLMFLSFLDLRFVFRVITAFIFGMLATEIISYLINFSIIPPIFYINDYEIYKTTISSPAPFYNHIRHNFGLSIVISYLLYQLLNKDSLSLKVKIFSILFMITATLNMSFVAGRTGYVVFLVSLFVVFLLTYKEKIVKALFSALVLSSILSILAYNYAPTVKARVDQTIFGLEKIIKEEDYKTSVGARIGLTKYGFEVFKENIIFGVGTGDFMDQVRKIIPERYSYLSDDDYIANPHNTHIQILMQLGLVGYFGLIFLFYTIFTYKNSNKYKKDLLIILSVSMLLYMIPSKLFETFSLPLFVTFISALVANKKYNIIYKEMTYKSLLYYIIFAIVFYIIGITR